MTNKKAEADSTTITQFVLIVLGILAGLAFLYLVYSLGSRSWV